MVSEPHGPIKELVSEVDGWLDGIVGIDPIHKVTDFLYDMGPANVINEMTGIPKPDTLIDRVVDSAVGVVDNIKASSPLRGGGMNKLKLPRMPWDQ